VKRSVPAAIPKSAAQIGSKAYRIAARTGSSRRWNTFISESASTVARSDERTSGTANPGLVARRTSAASPGPSRAKRAGRIMTHPPTVTQTNEARVTGIGGSRFVTRSVRRMWAAKRTAPATVNSSPVLNPSSGRPRMNPAPSVARSTPAIRARLGPRRARTAVSTAVKRT
jgi:hypothetical protein